MDTQNDKAHCHLICQVWSLKDPIFDRVYLDCAGAREAIEEAVTEWNSFGVVFSRTEDPFLEYECMLPVLGRMTLCVEPCPEDLRRCTSGTGYSADTRRPGEVHYHRHGRLAGRQDYFLKDKPYCSLADALLGLKLEVRELQRLGLPALRRGPRRWQVELPLGTLFLSIDLCSNANCHPLPKVALGITESIQEAIGLLEELMNQRPESRRLQLVDQALTVLKATRP